MRVAFESKQFPLLNDFLFRLQGVLKNIPNNPKSSCEGFYLTDYDSERGGLISEKIGFVPAEKDSKYLYLSSKKVAQTLYLGKNRSKDFENTDLEQYPGGIIFRYTPDVFGAGVSGHDSMIDEAIAILWSIVRRLIKLNGFDQSFATKIKFYRLVVMEARQVQATLTPDNEWVVIIAEYIEFYKD